MLELSDPRFASGNGLARHLVYALRAADVVTPVVDGDVLMDERRLTRLDPATVIAKYPARAARILAY